VKILITGGTGFIGAHLARYAAAEGHVVHICDNNARGKHDDFIDDLIENSGVKFLQLDMTLKEDVGLLEADYDIVFHLAAINGTENFYKIPYTVMDVAITSTMLLLQHFMGTKTKFVFTSSSEVYAGTINKDSTQVPTGEDVACTIEDVVNPRFSYGGSKLACEILINSFAQQYGIDYQVIRYHNIYGPRMGTKHVMPQFIRRAMEGEKPFRIYGAEQTRAFCYIDDATRATLSLALSDTPSGVYHIGNSQEEVEIIEVAKLVTEWYDLGGEFDVRSAPVGSVQRRCPNIKKLQDAIGFEPTITLKEGLNATISWYNEWYRTVDLAKISEGLL
tara:strand:- start:18098 stop:19096 length:999 start_codon:yes stop_codon:yes gene_type:complete